MQYVVRGRNNMQRAPLIQLPAHVPETMKFMGDFEVFGWDF